MVQLAQITYPIRFTVNSPKITVIFSDESNTHNNKLVNILLKTRIPSDISEWSFVHVLQDTNKIVLSGLDYKDYILEITSKEEINLKYSVSCQENVWKFDGINSQSNPINISVNKKQNVSRQFGGGGFGGALLTTGSFTMMAASGGF